jgi:hypothetical protein
MEYPDLTFLALIADFQEQQAIQTSVEEEIMWGCDEDD